MTATKMLSLQKTFNNDRDKNVIAPKDGQTLYIEHIHLIMFICILI